MGGKGKKKNVQEKTTENRILLLMLQEQHTSWQYNDNPHQKEARILMGMPIQYYNWIQPDSSGKKKNCGVKCNTINRSTNNWTLKSDGKGHPFQLERQNNGIAWAKSLENRRKWQGMKKHLTSRTLSLTVDLY